MPYPSLIFTLFIMTQFAILVLLMTEQKPPIAELLKDVFSESNVVSPTKVESSTWVDLTSAPGCSRTKGCPPVTFSQICKICRGNKNYCSGSVLCKDEK